MHSIRLSLIVYFLTLTALALGGVSWFVYQTTAQTLRDRKASTRDLIQAQYQNQCRDVTTDLDRRIRRQAQNLASMARSSKNDLEPLYRLGVLATRLQPQGYLSGTFWLAAGMDPGWSSYFHNKRPSDILIEDPDDMIPAPDPEQNLAQEYFQTYSKRGITQQRSEAMGDRFLTLDEEVRTKSDFLVEKFDTVEPAPGWKLRRVTLKASPQFRFRPSSMPIAWRFLTSGTKGFGPKGFGSKGPGTKGSGMKGPFPGPSDGPSPGLRAGGFEPPVVFIQYASDTSLLDQKLEEFRTQRDAKFGQLESETRASLAGLQLRLLWICLATFAGVVAGGLVLVRLGLAPLARLSEAVSQVSEKDFRLKIDTQGLPRELQPIAARLSGTLEQLKHAFAREKQAAADISHELRTPLAAMMTTLDLSLRKARSAQEYREMLEDIRSSGAEMAHLVERLLALARLDAGADRLRSEEVDARDIARQCANLIRPLAEARGLALRLDAPEPAPVHADPDKLREILNNLLHNAVEYNRPHGAIDVRVARVNGHLRLAVSDTGIGIALEQREQIFERFFRADPSRHADTPHAGLGLSIVKSYVDLMGGKIGVASSDCGSTFTIELPVPPPLAA